MTEVTQVLTMRAPPGLPVMAEEGEAPAFALAMADRAQDDAPPEEERPAPGETAAQMPVLAAFEMLFPLAKVVPAKAPDPQIKGQIALAATGLTAATQTDPVPLVPAKAPELPQREQMSEQAETAAGLPAPAQIAPVLQPLAALPEAGTTAQTAPNADLKAAHFPVSRQSALALRFRDLSDVPPDAALEEAATSVQSPEEGPANAAPQAATGPNTGTAQAAGGMTPGRLFPQSEPSDQPAETEDRAATVPASATPAGISAAAPLVLPLPPRPEGPNAALPTQTPEGDAGPPEAEGFGADGPVAFTAAVGESRPVPPPENPQLAPSTEALAPQPDPRSVQTRPDVAAMVDAGPAPMPRISAAELTQQIAGHISAQTSDRAEVVLSPAELGKVRFEITQRGEGVQIIVMVERPETLDLMRRNADQLLADLTAMGFSGSALGFGTWGDQTPAPPRSPQDSDPIEAASLPDATPIIPTAPSPRLPGGGLDLRL